MAPTAIPYSREETGRSIAARIPEAKLAVYDGTARALPVGIVQDFIRGIETAEHQRPVTSVLDRAPNGLSQREVEVLRLIAQGKNNQEIASELVISLNTVLRHVSNIFDKTGARNRTEAAVYARDKGLA
jgi:DNA-binding NarL/FixJ family response regulator